MASTKREMQDTPEDVAPFSEIAAEAKPTELTSELASEPTPSQNIDPKVADNINQGAKGKLAESVQAPHHDAPKNTGESPESEISRRSEIAEESALQNLNIDNSDSDSALGDMTPQTSTTSVLSGIYNYVDENGRTYHRYKEGKYLLPNDEDEMERLDLQHQLWLLTLHNELFLAPIPAPRNVLDIGTGTGIWAIELATRHPAAAVLGTDLSPMQPPYVPPNCAFEVDDAEDEWDYAARFDLIHGRALATCFRNPRGVIGSAFGQLAPGGYLEFHDLVLPMLDIDGTLAGTAVGDWQARTMAAAATLGMRWKETQNYARYFEEAGFVDVVEQHFQWPLNRWAKGDHLKMLGTYWQEDLNRGLEGLSMAALTRGGGMSREEVLVLTAEARKDIKKKSIHAYLPVVVVYGRKPDAAAS